MQFCLVDKVTHKGPESLLIAHMIPHVVGNLSETSCKIACSNDTLNGSNQVARDCFCS